MPCRTPLAMTPSVASGDSPSGNRKLVKIALLPGTTVLFDPSKDPGEQNNVADQFPEIARDL